MYLNQYKNSLKTPIIQGTLCFLVKDQKILLGLDKNDFTKGGVYGISGALEDEETQEHGAMRQCQEEVGVTLSKLEKVGTLSFYFQKAEKPELLNRQAHLFLSREWIGEIDFETGFQWYDFDSIPFEKMSSDTKMWLPQVLEGKVIEGEYLFDANNQVEEYNFKQI